MADDSRTNMPKPASNGSVLPPLPPGPRTVKNLGPERMDQLRSELSCPLCHDILDDATRITRCFHVFCRKCIIKSLTDGESKVCPICNKKLGSSPMKTLRPDFYLNEIIDAIFPANKRKDRAPEEPSSSTAEEQKVKCNKK